MKPLAFDQLCLLVKATSGLVLARDRLSAVEGRVTAVARREGFASADALIESVRSLPTPELIAAVVDAVTPSETWFFRDRAPFEALATEIAPSLLKARPGGRLRLWSAGCASGQEAYSMLMALHGERGSLGPLQVELLAVDLSERSLAKARTGLYTPFEVQRGLPIRLLLEHFDKMDEAWRVKPHLRADVRFARANLIGDLAPLGHADVIFLRNVLVGLDAPTRMRVIEGVARALADDGRLVIGQTESLGEASALFRPIEGQRGVYAKAAQHIRQAA